MTNFFEDADSNPPLSPYQRLNFYLKQLNLTYILKHWESVEQTAVQEGWSLSKFLEVLFELEMQQRQNDRLKKALEEAQLPNDKTLGGRTLKLHPDVTMRLMDDPSWLEEGENCLIFGASGVGKTHLACRVARRMIEVGKRVKFFSALALVQDLQQKRQQLQLQAALKELDRFDLLILDDLDSIKEPDVDISVLCNLISYRCERKSLLITINQPYNQWDSLFADARTEAAVDRLVHHALVVDLQQSRRRRAIVAILLQDPKWDTQPSEIE